MPFFTKSRRAAPAPGRSVRVPGRLHGRHVDLLDDVRLPAGDVTVTIESPAQIDFARALEESAGAWSAVNHPELRTPQDISTYLRGLRAGFSRYGG